MMRKEGVNVFLFPCGEAFGAVAQFLDAGGRIVDLIEDFLVARRAGAGRRETDPGC